MVLLIGIVSGSIIMLAGGHIAATDLLANMGSELPGCSKQYGGNPGGSDVCTDP